MDLWDAFQAFDVINTLAIILIKIRIDLFNAMFSNFNTNLIFFKASIYNEKKDGKSDIVVKDINIDVYFQINFYEVRRRIK